MSTSRTNRAFSVVAFILSLVTIAAAIWLYSNRQYVQDQLSVWSYEPSVAVQALNDKVQFTDKGLFAFYATKPVVSDPSAFNGQCPRQEAGSPILGCYTSDDRIYVFNISNKELDGIKEVTAAHEMLHAVWHRMDASEQKRIGELLTTAYEKAASSELRERMEYYQRTEPDSITNELHSILGTEVGNLGPELETYYNQYFQDRQRVLDLHTKYNTVYTALYTRADTLYEDMETLSKSIESRSDTYATDVSILSAEITRFNARANSGDFDSLAQFNQEKAVLVQRSNDLESRRSAIQNDISTYNRYYEEYKTLSSQIEGLNNSVDSFKALGEAPTV